MKKTTLVLGGTGHFGRQIVNSLIESNKEVKILTRKREKAVSILGNKVEIIEGDITDNNIFEKLLIDVDKIVISISAFKPSLIKKMDVIEKTAVINLLKAAERNGIQKIVYISTYELNKNLIEKYNLKSAEIKLEIENYLKNSSLNYKIIGTAPSMEIFFAMLKGSIMIVPGGGPASLPVIAPQDVGIIVDKIINKDDFNRKRVKVTGPGIYSFYEAKDIIAKELDKKIIFLPIPLIFPVAVTKLSKIFNKFSKKTYFFNELIGYIKLLNNFPQDTAQKAPLRCKRLIKLYGYQPISLKEYCKIKKYN